MHIETSASRLAEIADLVRRETFPSKKLSPLQRFRLACRRHDINITHSSRVATGFMYIADNRTRIVLPHRLRESHLEFVAFHELGHALLGPSSSTPIGEYEADLFSYLSLKPAID
jgi:Zn-dependent peptidase ImmA (M78 family)